MGKRKKTLLAGEKVRGNFSNRDNRSIKKCLNLKARKKVRSSTFIALCVPFGDFPLLSVPVIKLSEDFDCKTKIVGWSQVYDDSLIMIYLSVIKKATNKIFYVIKRFSGDFNFQVDS